MKKILFFVLVIGLSFSGGLIFASSSKVFSDVKPSNWFYNDVMTMADWGVINGNDDGTFRPASNVNRAELSAMFNRYDKKVTADVTVQVDELRYSQIQTIQENANLYQGISTVYAMNAAKPACSMLQYYYKMMKADYTVAKGLSDMIVTPELKIDSTVNDKKLSDFELIYNQCDFSNL
jgi:hypothetical protein